MSRVIWSEPIVNQLRLIREQRVRWTVIRALRALSLFPRRGRVPPEAELIVEARISAEIREIVFPGLGRVFYRFDTTKDIVRILGMSFRGQDVTPEWLMQN